MNKYKVKWKNGSMTKGNSSHLETWFPEIATTHDWEGNNGIDLLLEHFDADTLTISGNGQDIVIQRVGS